MRKGIVALSVSLLATTTLACDIHGISGIVEENNLYIPSNIKSVNSLTEKVFNEVIDKVEAVYAPIIEEKGATLNIERNWDDGTVNAYASQSGNTWKVAMFGGLARHETITADGFMTVVCHEIGHHIGGAPKKGSWYGTSWASNEGQADYFGTMKCLRKVMETENNVKIVSKMNVPAMVTEKCEKNFNTEEEIAICKRGAMAGKSLANLFKALRRMDTDLRFDTPDSKVVSRTDHSHPAPQCRLDTYFQGALCNVGHDVDVDQEDALIGTCNRVDGVQDGVRPLCWYKPENI
jgi:hypothetical protein